MHILLIHQAFASLDEAGGTRHAELANYLAEAGHRVTIIASPINYLTGQAVHPKMKWSVSQELRPGVRIVRTYTYAALHRSFFHRLLAFFSFMVSSFLVGLSIRQVDLVWGTSPPIFQGVTAWLLARLKRVPFLLEVRDLWPAFAVAAGVLKSPLLIAASTWLEKTLYRQADRVMVNSPGFIQHVLQGGARWVELIPNGADTAMFNPAANGQDFRANSGLGNNFVALYAGAHGMSNDLGVLLESARLLRDQPEIKFVLLGDGKEKKNLQAQAVQMQLKNLVFCAPVPKCDMPLALAAADACIAILKPLEMYKTTYPNKVFDYMAAGKPVLLLIDGVIRQVVEAGEAGIFISPGDAAGLAQAICRLAANPSESRRMGENGRRFVVNHFDRAVIAGKFLLLVEEMRREHA